MVELLTRTVPEATKVMVSQACCLDVRRITYRRGGGGEGRSRQAARAAAAAVPATGVAVIPRASRGPPPGHGGTRDKVTAVPLSRLTWLWWVQGSCDVLSFFSYVATTADGHC